MTRDGVKWLTVPVRKAGGHNAKIKDIEIDNTRGWQRKMWATIEQSYGKYPHFETYRDELRYLVSDSWERLAPLAERTVRWGFAQVGRAPSFLRASEMDVDADDPVRRIVDLCQAVSATRYLSGPAGKNYIDETKFQAAGIELEWMNYSYPSYPQVRVTDVPLSILDLLFNSGPDASSYIWT